jgi:hypothetical protein
MSLLTITEDKVNKDIDFINSLFPFYNTELFNHNEKTAIYTCELRENQLSRFTMKELKNRKLGIFSIDLINGKLHVKLIRGNY